MWIVIVRIRRRGFAPFRIADKIPARTRPLPDAPTFRLLMSRISGKFQRAGGVASDRISRDIGGSNNAAVILKPERLPDSALDFVPRNGNPTRNANRTRAGTGSRRRSDARNGSAPPRGGLRLRTRLRYHPSGGASRTGAELGSGPRSARTAPARRPKLRHAGGTRSDQRSRRGTSRPG